MIEALQSIDLQLLAWLRPYHAPWLDRLMIAVSASGIGAGVWLVMAILAMAMRRHRAAAWRVLLAVGLAYLMVDGIFKPLIARPRPESVDAVDPARALPPLPRTYSFPSGHAASTFAAAVTVSRMWPDARVLWWLLALAIGYSRIYLGHHYPLDVAGGALLGLLLGWWVLGGRHPATDPRTLPSPLPAGVVVRP